MQRKRADECSYRWNWRPLSSAVALASALLWAGGLTACHTPKALEDPASTYQSIRSDLLRGNLDVAHQRAEQEREKLSATNVDWSIRFRLLEAEILTYQGRRQEVLALLTEKSVAYPSNTDVAIERDLLCGSANSGLGQAKLAEQQLREARSLSDSSHSKLNGQVLRAEARAQFAEGNLDRALQLYKESQQAARELNDTFLEASDLLNIGWVELTQEHYDEAIASLNAAADFARPIQARPVMEAALGNIGVAYFHLGDFEKALANYQKAEAEAIEIGTTSAEIDWLVGAGASEYKLGKFREAKNYYEQSLKAAMAINASEEIADTNTALALLLLEEGQLDSAKEHSNRAIRAASSSGDKSAALEPRFVQALLAARMNDGSDPEKMLLQVHEDSTGSSSLRWEIENALANFYNAKSQITNAELWYRRSILTFEDKRAAVEDEENKLPFFANGDALYRDYANFLISSHREDDALKLLDVGRARTLAEGLGSAKQENHVEQKGGMSPQSVARKLDATILFYSLGPEKSYLWAVTPAKTRLFELPKQQEIESRVQSYQRAILKSSDPLREANANATYLYDTIVAPAESMIPTGGNVFVIPDGGLNALNFETLIKTEGDRSHYWIEDVTITNANSIRLLSRLNPVTSKDAGELLLIGDPVSPEKGFEPLENAPAEIEDIKRHFRADSERVLTQAAAVPSAYGASSPDKFSYIHFVAHGTASRLSPLDSAVVLSASAGHPDDYKLYAREIVHYPLHARLVTISSCYGSGLRAYAGEELVGLSWAFLRAGAHNVIGALWEVNDASTPQLMDRLYGELEGGSKPDAALRTAKLAMMRSDGNTRKPLYWAAFQLYAGS